MPRVVERDDENTPIYGPPDPATEPEWDLEGGPEEMNVKALCAAVARDILGCQIKWWGYYCDWCCGCRGTPHGCDSQCSSLATPDQMFKRVIEICDEEGIALLAQAPEQLLRSALIAWRADE